MEQQRQSCSTISTIRGTESEPQGDVTLHLPDLSLGVASLSGPIDMDLGISINVGAEADLGEFP